MSHDVFISYSNEDKNIADAVCDNLEQKGMRCWIAPRDVLPGKNYGESIVDAIKEAEVLVLILSAYSNQSPYVMREVERAVNSGTNIVHFRVEDVAPSKQLEFFISSAQWQDALTPPLEAHINSLAQTVGKLLNKPTPSNKGVQNYVKPQSGIKRNAPPKSVRSKSFARKPSRVGSFERKHSLLNKIKGIYKGDSNKKEDLNVDIKNEVLEFDDKNVYGMEFDKENLVDFTLTSPSSVSAGEWFIIELWAHTTSQYEEALIKAKKNINQTEISEKSIGPRKIKLGTEIKAVLDIKDAIIKDPIGKITWLGEISNIDFCLKIPNGYDPTKLFGTIFIYVNDLQIGRLYFEIKIGDMSSKISEIPINHEFNKKAFASYSSDDRSEVLARIHGMEKVAPYLDIFMDVNNLRSGDNWKERLKEEISSCEVFYLFWSENAMKSEWVEKEWKCALKIHGIDVIDPVPLVCPKKAPVPPELSNKHFNDRFYAFNEDC